MLENSYWNIDSILLGLQNVDCKLNHKLSFLNDLYPGQENSDQFNTNEIVKLPLTLAITMSDSDMVKFQTPKILTKDFYDSLKADSTVPSLDDNKYFYDEYLMMKNIINDEKKKNWDKCIIDANYKRYLNFFNSSFNTHNMKNAITKKTAKKERIFLNQMININNNNQYYQENYENNNKVLDDKIEAKKNRQKIKMKKQE